MTTDTTEETKQEAFNRRMADLLSRMGVDKNVQVIVESGALEIESAGDDYWLPMSVLAVALEMTARQWAPSKSNPNHRAHRKLRAMFV